MLNQQEPIKQSKHKPTILFVSHQGRLEGGADHVLAVLLESFNRDQFHPYVLLPRRASLTAKLDEIGIKYIIVPYRAWMNVSRNIFGRLYRLIFNTLAVLPLYWRLHRQNIDLIYSNSLYSPVGAILAYLLKIPHIWHVHELVEQGLGAYFDWGAEKSLAFVDKVSTAIVTNSEAVYHNLNPHVKQHKLHVVYNGLSNLDELLRVQRKSNLSQKVRISIVGNISPHKRQEDAIRALAIIKAKGVNAILQVVGHKEAPYADFLQALARELDVASYVIWMGFVNNMVSVYEETDILLSCSQSEGFGLAIVEALASGTPVIATNAGGVPEIIEHGINGLLYEPRDYKTLAAHILTLVNDQTLYKQMASQARASVQDRYTVENFVEKIETVILDVLSTSAELNPK